MPRDGRFVATIGHYNPTTEPAVLKVDRDKALAWLDKGAMPTDTVRALFRKAGVHGEAPAEGVVATVKSVAGKAAGAAKGAAGAVAAAASAAATAVSGAASSVAHAASSVAETVTETVSDAAATVVETAQHAAAGVAEAVSGGSDEGSSGETPAADEKQA